MRFPQQYDQPHGTWVYNTVHIFILLYRDCSQSVPTARSLLLFHRYRYCISHSDSSHATQCYLLVYMSKNSFASLHASMVVLSLKAGSMRRLANCTVANLKLAWNKFHYTYMFKWSFQRAVLRQTYHVANTMPESPVFAISQGFFWLQTFLELFWYLLLVFSSCYNETFM